MRQVSSLSARRWRNFKANRRGFISLWLFGILFFVTLFAEFLANDKPLLVLHDGGVYMPVFVAYPETDFGGDFATEADYRDPYVAGLIEGAGGSMVWPLLRYSYDTINLDLTQPAHLIKHRMDVLRLPCLALCLFRLLLSPLLALSTRRFGHEGLVLALRALHLDEETGSLYVGDLSAVRCVALDSAAVRFAIGHGPAGVPSGPGAPGDAESSSDSSF